MEDHAGHFPGCWFARQAVQLNILEAVIGEMRLKNLQSISLAEVTVDLPVTLAEVSGAQIVDIDRTVRIKNFPMLHGNDCACRCLHLKTGPAAEELPHVCDINTRAGLGDSNRCDLPGFTNRLTALPDELARFKIELLRLGLLFTDDNRGPMLIIITCLIPTGHLPPSIINLALIDAGEAHRTIRGSAPGLIGHNQVPSTVGILNFKLRDQAGITSVGRVQFFAPLHPSTTIPAVA